MVLSETWRYVVRTVKCGAMHDVADIVRFEIMVLQSGIVCCERCWCDTKCAIW